MEGAQKWVGGDGGLWKVLKDCFTSCKKALYLYVAEYTKIKITHFKKYQENYICIDLKYPTQKKQRTSFDQYFVNTKSTAIKNQLANTLIYM